MAAVNALSAANEFARSYLKANPKATQEQVQVEVRNHLQQLKTEGAKISDKQIAKVNAQIGEIYKANVAQLQANSMPQATPKAKDAVKTLNQTQAATNYERRGWVADKKADLHYDDFNGLNKKARQRLHKRNMADAKAAFADERFAEPVETAPKQEVKQEEYQSSKKKKKAKKEAEIKSQQEHKAARPPKDSKVRKEIGNAKYCTQQGIMTQNARKHFKQVANGLDGSVQVIVDDKPNSTLQKMKEYYMSLGAELGDTTPFVSGAPKTQEAPKAPKTTAPKTKAPKAADVAEAVEEAVKTVKNEAKGKGKAAWIAAGIATVGAGVAALFLNKNDNSEKLEETA